MTKKTRSDRRDLRPASQVVHAGQRPDPSTGAVMQPVYLTSTYRQPGPGQSGSHDYARTINPTRSALERQLAELESGRSAFAFASGMAAIHATLSLLDTGSHVVVSHDAYGGTRRLFEGLFRRLGIEFSWVDTATRGQIEAALRPETRMLFVESPTNPLLRVTDLAAAARIARRRRLRLVVDNTFLTPWFQQPLRLGADLVVHSTTKYLNGHSDSVGGAVVAARRPDGERLAWIQKSVGAILSPLDSYLVLRGIKTLGLRMERHESNARDLATWLARQSASRAVHYPGLPDHPQHALARRQAGGFGGVISFDLGSAARARQFVRRLKLCQYAESLGGVESLVSYPATMSHGSLTAAEREAAGVTDGLLRLSVGIEDVEDLRNDLARGLSGLRGTRRASAGSPGRRR